MANVSPLAKPADVTDLLPPIGDYDTDRIERHILKASASLRQVAPFDIDERIGLFLAAIDTPIALDPLLVATVVATIVKTFMINVEGVASRTDTEGPNSTSLTLVNRYDKSGSDTRGRIQATDADVQQLRPAVPSEIASSFRVGIPDPQLVIQHSWVRDRYGRSVPIVVPDFAPGSGVE